MLARLSRSSYRRAIPHLNAPAASQACSQPAGWQTACEHCAQQAVSITHTAAAGPDAPAWPTTLTKQIAHSAKNFRARYEGDSHKFLSDAAVDEAQEVIGHRFQNRQLLRLAFTHSSISEQCNIPLAWIGDSVLQLIIVEGLMSRYPAASVGDLATLRAAMSSRVACYKYAQQFELQKWLVASSAALRLWINQLSPESYPHNVVAELYEAVLGAIYVDAGLARSQTWFAKHIDWPKHHSEANKRFITDSSC